MNESVADGATLHWHGIDVPNAADGVAGITQDAVPLGGRHVYRFEATDAGTYWYHSHQVSHEQVERGLLGRDRDRAGRARLPSPRPMSSRCCTSTAASTRSTVGSRTRAWMPSPGSTVRVRVINTDQGTAAVWSAAPLRVLATDGHEVNEPTDVEGQRMLIPAGGRADVAVQAPSHGAVRLHVGGARSVLIGDPEASVPRTPQPSTTLDLLAYGTAAPLGIRRDRA